jgi:mannose-1-phosphate guanylyltransferase
MNNSNTYIAIMAGGIGSRFWPASREARPKQFMDILGVGKSLIRLTFERFLKLAPAENIFILTNAMYKGLVLEHLPELTEDQILCEPSRNNTAPCVAYTALKLHNLNPEANFVVAPSDHVILDEDTFVETLQKGLDFTAQNDALLTLGIQPTRPDTGYGYINYEKDAENGIHKVIRFTEKPKLEKAKKMLESGDYLWNAGIFVWRTKAILTAFQSHAASIYEVLSKGDKFYNTPDEQGFINENYPLTTKISIDFAIMEKAKNVYTIPSSFGWSDLGTWGSLYAESEKDEQGNVLNAETILLDDVQNCLIRAPKNKLLVLKGLDNFIVIDEGDVLMIYPKDKEQEIRKVTETINSSENKTFL